MSHHELKESAILGIRSDEKHIVAHATLPHERKDVRVLEALPDRCLPKCTLETKTSTLKIRGRQSLEHIRTRNFAL